jgi:guanine nucleotide-binding protein subunit beta-2-like 1 protein
LVKNIEKAHSKCVNSLIFTHSSDYLISGSYDKSIKIWETSDWSCKRTLKEHTSDVLSLSLIPGSNGDFVSASDDYTIKFWNTN